jgi:hypothetical protein
MITYSCGPSGGMADAVDSKSIIVKCESSSLS